MLMGPILNLSLVVALTNNRWCIPHIGLAMQYSDLRSAGLIASLYRLRASASGSGGEVGVVLAGGEGYSILSLTMFSLNFLITWL